MKIFIKHSLIIVGIVLILTPTIGPRLFPGNPLLASLFKSSPQSTTDNSQPITNNPYSPSTYVSRAQSLISDAQSLRDAKLTAQLLQKSLEILEEGIHFFPHSATLVAQRGDLYTLLAGNVADSALFAFRDYSQAASLNPQESSYAQKAATIALQLNRYDDAIKLLRQALAANKDPQLLLALADAQTKAGNLSEAVTTYTTLLSLLPSGSTEAAQVNDHRKSLALLLNQQESYVQGLATVSADLLAPTASPQLASPSQGGPIGGFDAVLPTSNPSVPSEVVLSQDPSTNPYTTRDADAFSGIGLLPQGQRTTIITNKNVTSDHAVYVTATSHTNQVLSVSSKTTGSFTVSIDKPSTTSIEFQWWIK